MSFAFMPFYTGDYLRDTRHLTPLKHGVYLLLLMHCWDQKGPAPLDEQECAGIANCRSADEIDSLRYVLDRYFVRLDDGWYNKRMMQEIESANALSSKRSGAAHARWEARQKLKDIQVQSMSNASAMQVHSKCTTPTPTPTPTTIKEEKQKTHTRFSAREYLLSKGVDQQTAIDYLAIRRAKKLTPTLKSMEAIEAEAGKAGISFVQAIETCCSESWAGFKASWMEKVKQVEKQPWEGAV